MSHRGSVALVGAGPGDPELITVRGLALVRRAEVLLFDRLVAEELVGQAPASALKIDVGKSPTTISGRRSVRQEEIVDLLLEHAQCGRFVVRLKGGDPFVFGRGGEEVLACAEAGIPCEVVPGVSSALAAPASAGIPVTHRGVAASFAVVTGHCAPQETAVSAHDRIDWDAASRLDTLVILMGLARLDEIVAALLQAGREPTTPAAVIAQGTLPSERIVVGTLATLCPLVAASRISAPATIVVGEVVRLRTQATLVATWAASHKAPLDGWAA
jgi:uroporphyrin-III C-methyltransferase